MAQPIQRRIGPNGHPMALFLCVAFELGALLFGTGCSRPTPTSDAGVPPQTDICASLPSTQGLSRVRMTGRYQVRDGGYRFAWSGTGTSVKFNGTSLFTLLEDSGKNQYLVLVDGEPRPDKLLPKAGRNCYELAQGLTRGDHEVTLYRLTEAFLGESTVFGFAVPAPDRLLDIAPSAERRMEIIGDSISAAYGIEGADQNCHFSPDTENHYQSYGAVLARRLGATLITTAWSGKGVFSNRGSTTDTVPMPVLWERALPERADSAWDFASYVPQAVIINLGTNDFAQENPDKSPFAEAYLTFLRKVRQRYPKAALFCALGPLLSDAWPPGENALSTARQQIQNAVRVLNTEGDLRVFFVEHAQETETEGYGCDWHPNLRAHTRMATELESLLKSKLGW